MLLPENILVVLAGQKAWHIWAGEELPRISGKYLPSQLRTQKAGPPPEATGRGGGAGPWREIGKEIRLRRRLVLLFLDAAEKHVEQAFGGSRWGASPAALATMAAATGIMRRRMR